MLLSYRWRAEYARDPEERVSWLLKIAELHVGQSNADQAREVLQSALVSNPEHQDVLLQLEEVLASLGLQGRCLT